MMKSQLIIASFVCLGVASCSKSTKESAATSTEEITTAENGTAEASDLSATSEQSNANNGENATSSGLNAEGSSLTGNQSNLNLDINLSADQLFEFDKANLKPQADVELEKAFSRLKGKSEAVIKVIGYTDGKGSASYNKDLSLRRANAIKTWLETNGYSNPISVEGKGAADPIAPNTHSDGSDNPEGRAKNRRVEIKVTGKTSL